MAIIGWNGVGVNTAEAYGSLNYPNASLYEPYTANAGDKLTKISAYGSQSNATDPQNLQVALYEYSGGVIGARLGDIINISISSTTPGWFDSADLDISLSAGTTYVVAMAYQNFDSVYRFDRYYSDETDMSNSHNASGALPSTWASSGLVARRYSLYATITESGTSYTKGSYASLPGTESALETAYTENEIINVGSKNDVRVSVSGTDEYLIHQFKDVFGTARAVTVEWEGQTSVAPSSSTVYLQIYNYNTNEWSTIDSDNSSSADTDFVLTADVSDLTNYTSGTNITCRVYQYI